jgi:endoglycosylceramidase
MRVFCLAFVLAATANAGTLTAKDGRFVDAMGATVILRGVNVAGDSKVPPFRPAMDPSIFDPLPGWGLNVVRLLFTWEAYEPEMGQYDDSYLAYYKSAVEAAWARGLYVLVDFHQDDWSRYLVGGCGEGYPQWTIPAAIARATPDNGADCANWGSRGLGDDDLHATWNAFYADSEGARAAYLDLIGRVATALAGEPGVLGYDLLNEPTGDEPTQLGPLYELAAPVIRAADPSAIIFESPQILTGGGEQTSLPKPTFDNVAYSPHYYDPLIVLIHGWGGTEPDEPFTYMTSTAQSWGAPLFLGEFGAPPSTDMLLPYMDTMYAHLDDALASGAEWAYTPGWTQDKKDGWNTEDFSIVDDTGALRANFVVRPFARRIAGVPATMLVTGDELTLEWQNDPSAGATEIFAPHGEASASGDVKCARKGSLVTCSSATSGDKTVRIKKETPACGLTGAECLMVALCLRALRRRTGNRSRLSTIDY